MKTISYNVNGLKMKRKTKDIISIRTYNPLFTFQINILTTKYQQIVIILLCKYWKVSNEKCNYLINRNFKNYSYFSFLIIEMLIN